MEFGSAGTTSQQSGLHRLVHPRQEVVVVCNRESDEKEKLPILRLKYLYPCLSVPSQSALRIADFKWHLHLPYMHLFCLGTDPFHCQYRINSCRCSTVQHLRDKTNLQWTCKSLIILLTCHVCVERRRYLRSRLGCAMGKEKRYLCYRFDSLLAFS